MWRVEHPTFDDFRQAALGDSDRVFLHGYLDGTRRDLTLSSLLEERRRFTVAGTNGWRAIVEKLTNTERRLEFAERSTESSDRNARRNARVPIFRVIRMA